MVNTVFKIRLLLLILTLCFIGTAITINLTFNEREVLILDARIIESNLHKKERVITDFLTDTAKFALLRNINDSVEFAEDIIQDFAINHHIYFYTYTNNELAFWNTEKFVPKTDAGISDGTSIIEADNGIYAAIKKSSADFSVLGLIPVKSDFQKKNAYLENTFSKDLIKTNNLEIASYSDSQTYNIRSLNGEFLFAVKLNGTQHNTFYSKLELAMWLLAGLCTILLLNIICIWIARKGWVWSSALLFACCVAGIRYMDLHTGWLASHFYTGIFDPRYFASSFLFPNLGSFLLNVITFTWFVGYFYAYKDELRLPSFGQKKIGNICIVFAFGLLIFLVGHAISITFSGLISNSDINFDVTDILSLNIYSWLGILALCISMMGLLLLIDLLVSLSRKLVPNMRKLMIVQVVAIVCAAGIQISLNIFSLAFFLLAGLVILRTWYSTLKEKFELALFISTLLLLAGMASEKHSQFQRYKKQEAQKLAIQRLESIDDANALALFFDLEREIVQDPLLINYFRKPHSESGEAINEHLKRTYLSGYLSKYEFVANEYSTNLIPLGISSASKLEEYRNKVISGAFKVSENFYRGNSSFGNFEYFAQLPVEENGNQLGVLLIELRNRSFSPLYSYPDILVDSRIDQQQTEWMSQYSYAFYREGVLVSQFGKYVYPTTDESYPTEKGKIISTGYDGGFGHFIKRPNSRTLIVVSKPQQSSWMQLASLSFLFLVFLMFAIIAYTVQWLILTLNSNDFSLRNLRWSFLILNNRILYSTRIQTFMVAAVVFTLITTGIITYFSISRQFKIQQEDDTLKYVADIAKGLESRMIKDAATRQGLYTDEQFNAIAESIASDLNLYSTEGELIYSTQPRIYDLRLISRYMNPEAWLHMTKYERAEFIHYEDIGKLNYIAAYAPIKDEKYESVAFLSLPYFSNQKEFDKNIGILLNTLINIYALVILVLGLFAVFVANKITAPLTLVQRSLARTIIGRQNEPIFWKRNDEIGSLIKEYNLMIVALEQSANKIVRSERESAWREMAKQVAHEIKNPLTPLKLGIQHLERSWKEKDPRFDEKFERFNESFIEQIESLSHIASEFSNFAKMPDTQLEDVEILDIIGKTIAVFNNNVGVSIQLINLCEADNIVIKGDRDQLLRSFNNLIKNSIEAAVGKRKCRIDITIGYDAKNNVTIEVKDNGYGIRLEVRERIFQPNFTTKSSGTGLGLAFVKQAVESIGGSISYETEIGKGTVFYLVIPRLGAAPN